MMPGAQSNREAWRCLRCSTSQRDENRPGSPLQLVQGRAQLCQHSPGGSPVLCSIGVHLLNFQTGY